MGVPWIPRAGGARRVDEYVRVSTVKVRGERGSRGAVGALSQLFERYPTLAAWLLLQVKQRRVLLEQINTDGRLRTRLRGLQALHDEFLRQCRSVGLTAADYPFNTAGHAIRSLSQRLKAEMLRSFARRLARGRRLASERPAASRRQQGGPRPQAVRIRWSSSTGIGSISG